MSTIADKTEPVPAVPADYEIGRGRPPVATRFAKGQSGNPSGKPKGARNRIPAMNEERLKAIILEEAYRNIKVNDGNGRITMPIAQAVIRSIAVGAAKGQPRAQGLFTTLLAAVEKERRELHEKWLDAMMDHKLHWENELDRRRTLGLPDPPLPPDQIALDLIKGTANLEGPTRDEQALLDESRALAEAKGLACPLD